jgi:hypothetical protein
MCPFIGPLGVVIPSMHLIPLRRIGGTPFAPHENHCYALLIGGLEYRAALRMVTRLNVNE